MAEAATQRGGPAAWLSVAPSILTTQESRARKIDENRKQPAVPVFGFIVVTRSGPRVGRTAATSALPWPLSPSLHGCFCVTGLWPADVTTGTGSMRKRGDEVLQLDRANIPCRSSKIAELDRATSGDRAPNLVTRSLTKGCSSSLCLTFAFGLRRQAEAVLATLGVGCFPNGFRPSP